MIDHAFIFNPNTWFGTGIALFSPNTEAPFQMDWFIKKIKKDEIACKQVLNVPEANIENITNHYRIFDIREKRFSIELENEMVGKIVGVGLADKDIIAWEFRNQDNFEAYEIFEKNQDGKYQIFSEFATPDQKRTVVKGTMEVKK